MGFQKIPSSTLLHLYFGSLFASDGRTDGQTDRQTDGRRANFLERYVLITIPSGFDKGKKLKGRKVAK